MRDQCSFVNKKNVNLHALEAEHWRIHEVLLDAMNGSADSLAGAKAGSLIVKEGWLCKRGNIFS